MSTNMPVAAKLGEREVSGSSSRDRGAYAQSLTNLGRLIFVHIGPYWERIGRTNLDLIWTNMQWPLLWPKQASRRWAGGGRELST